MTSPVALGQSARVVVNGSPLPDAAAAMLEQLVVDLAVGMPGVTTLRFRDARRSDRPPLPAFAVGQTVDVLLNPLGEPDQKKVFSGEVTSLEFEYDARGATVVVRAHDTLHRLTRAHRTRSFANAKDSDIVQKVLQDAGVAVGRITQTHVVHPFLGQVGRSDWDFVLERTRASGMVLVAQDGKIDMVPLDAPGPAPVDLVVGKSLSRLRVRLSSAAQVSQVAVLGWDPKTKKSVVGQAAPKGSATTGAHVKTPAQLASSFGSPRRSTGTSALLTHAAAQQAAENLAARLGDARADLEGTALGDPDLKPRSKVRLVGSAPAHDGTYVLTRVQHVVDGDGYRTRVESTGGEDRGLRALTGSGSGGASSRQRVPGVATGVVTNIKDGTRGAQVRLKLPWLSDVYETGWVRICTPGAGKDRGLTWLPDVGDEVLVAFDQGDTLRPYVLGGLWNGQDTPPADASLDDGQGKRTKRTLRSAKGHTLTLSDDQKALEVRVRSAQGHEVVLDDTGKALTVTMAQGGGTLTLDSKGKVVVKAAMDVQVEAGSRLLLEGKAGVVIKGAMVDIQASGIATLKGALVKIN